LGNAPLRQIKGSSITHKSENSQKPTTETTIDEHDKTGVLSDIELDVVAGGTNGAMVQAGWNLAQNKRPLDGCDTFADGRPCWNVGPEHRTGSCGCADDA
jgi:hypothetical protein